MRHGPRALLAALASVLAPSAVFAQSCDTCGPRIGNSYGHSTKHCNRIYPLFEHRYIKQFCGPHVSPEACFGYFKTQVTPWGQACPNWPADPVAAVATPADVVTPTPTPTAPAPAAIPPAAPLVTPSPKPADAVIPGVPAPMPAADPAPKPPTGPLPKVPTPDLPRVPR